jgi:hypothetical protein
MSALNTTHIFPFAEATINMLLQLVYPHLNPLPGKEEGKNAPVGVLDRVACCNARGSFFSRPEKVRMRATRLMDPKHKETTAR